jgi:hypothetical protein
METINRVRTKVWALQPESFRELAILDADGTIAPLPVVPARWRGRTSPTMASGAITRW